MVLVLVTMILATLLMEQVAQFAASNIARYVTL
jgi:hypothetical protein